MTSAHSETERLTRIPRISLRVQVYDQLRQLILSNQLSPGVDLTIDSLAEQLSISHTPIREALGMLELDGLIVMGPHKTPRVSDIHPQDVRDVYEMRIVLEGWAAEQVVAFVSEKDLAEADRILSQVEREARQKRLTSHVDADVALHMAIVRPIKNPLFQRLYQIAGDRSVRIRSLVEARSSQETSTILKEHRSILAALRKRNPQQARARVEHHLRRAMERTLATLSAMNPPEHGAEAQEQSPPAGSVPREA